MTDDGAMNWSAYIDAVLMHPASWREALRAAWAHRRRGWWHRRPFLPIPSSRHLAWRMETAYGSSAAPMDERDLEEYLKWRRAQRSIRI